MNDPTRLFPRLRILSAVFLLSAVACDQGGASSGAQGGQGGNAGASAGGTGGSGGTGGNSVPVAGLLVDDFEDGNTQPELPGGWYGYTDVTDGGLSTVTFTGGAGSAVAVGAAGFESSKSIEVSYAFDQGALTYAPFVGLGVSLGSAAAPIDLSAYSGIQYSYRGGAHRVQLQTTEVQDYDYYGVTLAASASWKTVTLPFKAFTQEDWGTKVAFAPSHVLAVDYMIRGATGGSDKLALDNLYVVKTTGPAMPDMMVQAAAPPADGSITSIAIANPLQAKALQYLDRGYNVTNWLEQERFSGFRYDEAFVEKLAAAGFKGLRLPIDFDLYVASTTGSGDSLSITIDQDLFDVIDAFDEWTRAHGLSLTLDYHQYSTLPDTAEPDTITTAVQLWQKVAEHVADNPRDDLFLELFNEPELSFGGTDPTQAEWTAIATRMIAAIRASDTTHSIIFGDTSWYGIAPLSTREPLADKNVIYAFHTYDPFIFTHQGASWANLGSTHDLPYPYDPARWSQYYADLGFNAAMEPWVLTAAQSYYREGNRSALRNRILAAKRWAVSHDVPVICNEFGAYDGTSRLEDRARYYTDLVSIFEELEIPWQHWFMIMNDAGDVIPEYRAAMHLAR
jgi:licheninase